VGAAAGRAWPNAVGVLLPAILAFCAAGAGFVFDEPASAVVAVTPRGAGWRRTTRASVALLPLVVWFGVLASVPAFTGTERAAWGLVGAACVLLATAAAGLASRAQVTAPGASIAAVLALGLLGPHLMSPFLGWDPLPAGTFPASALTFWLVVTGAGVLACAWALRPGLR
jgi:hypothetical protein